MSATSFERRRRELRAKEEQVNILKGEILQDTKDLVNTEVKKVTKKKKKGDEK